MTAIRSIIYIIYSHWKISPNMMLSYSGMFTIKYLGKSKCKIIYRVCSSLMTNADKIL